MSILFEPSAIKNLKLRNRIVRSATFEGLADFEGRPTPELKELYYDLAEGEVGLIITSGASVERFKNMPNDPGLPYHLLIDDDHHIEVWKPILDGIHRRGAKVAMQIAHLGRLDIPSLRGGPAIAPSAVPSKDGKVSPREATHQEIQILVKKFAESCRRVKEAGFDAVQLHAGHGYLISNFISPYFNTREDEYGGSSENRSRFIKEIVREARRFVGDEFPIMTKMNCEDYIDDGLEIEEATRIASLIADAEIDCIEVTGGVGKEGRARSAMPGINKPKKEAYFKAHAASLKGAVNIPIILVGGLRTPSVMESILEEGIADLLSICRPLIREPNVVKRWHQGDPSKSVCVSCNKCRENIFVRSLRCYKEQKPIKHSGQ